MRRQLLGGNKLNKKIIPLLQLCRKALASNTRHLLLKTSALILQRLCNSGAQVLRNVYPGLGHDPVVYGSLRDQLDWIAARFAGEPAPSNCPSQSKYDKVYQPGGKSGF